MAPDSKEVAPPDYESLRRKDAKEKILEDAFVIVDQKKRAIDLQRNAERAGVPHNNAVYERHTKEIADANKRLRHLASDWYAVKLFGKDQKVDKAGNIVITDAKVRHFEKKVLIKKDHAERRAERDAEYQAELEGEDDKDSDRLVSSEALRPGPGGVPATGERLAYRATMDQYLMDQASLASVAQKFVENGISPADLMNGSRQGDAIRLAFPPHLAQEILAKLASGPGSGHDDAIKTLQVLQSKLDARYEVLKIGKVGTEQMGRATLEGSLGHKTVDFAKEVVKNPLALGGFVASIVGMYLLYSSRTVETKKSIRNFLTWTAVGVGGLIAVDFGMDKLSASHRGLWDRIGMSPNKVISPVIVDQLRARLSGIPSEDMDTVDDLAEIVTLNARDVTAVYEDSIRTSKKDIDPNRFLSKGLSPQACKRIDGGSLKTALDHVYGRAAEQSSIETGIPLPLGKDDRAKVGIDYVRSHYSSDVNLLNVVYDLDVRSKAIASEAYKPLNIEASAITDANLNGLIAQSSSLGELIRLSESSNGTYLVKGYPFEYRYDAELKEHIFRDAWNKDAQAFRIKGADKDIGSLVDALVSAADHRATEKLTEKFAGEKFSFKGGYWVPEPPKSRPEHAGLKAYKPDVTLPIRAVAGKDGYELVLDVRGAEGKRYAAFDTSADKTMENDFDVMSGLYMERVRSDADHLLMGMPVDIVSLVDTATETIITVRSPTGVESTLSYENNQIKSLSIGQPDLDLDNLWDTRAKVEVRKFMSSPDIQAKLKEFTFAFAQREGLSGYAEGAWERISGLAVRAADWVMPWDEDSLDREFKDAGEKKLVKEIIDMQKNMANDFKVLYGTSPTPIAFKAGSQTIIDREVQFLTGGGLEKAYVDEAVLDKDGIDAMKSKGLSDIKDALAPISSLSDSIQRTYYEEISSWYEQELDKRVGSAGNRRDVIQGVIDIMVQDARNRARPYIGVSEAQAQMMLNQESMDAAANPEWKRVHDVAYLYLNGSFKWESYIVFSNPDNLRTVMKDFEEKIAYGTANINPSYSPEQYLNFYLSEIFVMLGGHQDWSPDRAYGTVFSVNDTDFDSKKAAVRNIPDYAHWAAIRPPDIRPAPANLTSASNLERAKDQVRDNFMADIDANMKVGGLVKLDHKWPEYFTASVRRRADWIRTSQAINPLYTAALYEKDLVDFRKFVLTERNFFELMIQHRVEPKHKGMTVEQIINDSFYSAWPAKNYHQHFLTLEGKFVSNDPSWWEFWKKDAIIVEAHDSTILGKIFNIPFF